MNSKPRIGLLGGSFNPPHNGHLKMALAAKKALGLCEVWLLVSPQNPLKPIKGMAPFEDRFNMCKYLSEGYAWLKPSDYEARHHTRFSADTAQSLKTTHPGITFFWLMGADNLNQLHRWKNWQTLTNNCPIAIFRRPGTPNQGLNSPAATALAYARVSPQSAKMTPPNWRLLDNAEVPLSATDVRIGRVENKNTLPKAVARYIALKNLYPRTIIEEGG